MDSFDFCELDITAILTVEEKAFLDSLGTPDEDTDLRIGTLSGELDHYFDLDFE